MWTDRRPLGFVGVEFAVTDNHAVTVRDPGDARRRLAQPREAAQLLKPGFIDAVEAGRRANEADIRIGVE